MPGKTTRSRDLGRRPFLGRGSAERTWPVWAALLGAPAAWAVAVGASYVLVPVACDLGTVLPLHGLRAVTAAVAVATALGSYGVWQVAHGRTQSPVLRRTAFLAFLGVVVAGFSALLIVLEGVANFAVDPCR